MWIIGAAHVGAPGVAAADAWMREVRFVPQPGNNVIFEYNGGDCATEFGGNVIAAGTGCGQPSNVGTRRWSAWIGTEIGEPSAIPGEFEPVIDGHTLRFIYACGVVPPAGGSSGVRLRISRPDGLVIDWQDIAPCTTSGSSGERDILMSSGSMPGIDRLGVGFAYGRYLTYLRIEDLDVETAGNVDCAGVAGAGGDAGLVIPAVGLATGKSGGEWGDRPVTDSAHTSYGACTFDDPRLMKYYPPEGLDEGETHVFGVEVATSWPWQECRVLFQWVGTGPAVNIFNHVVSGENAGGALGPGAIRINSNVPPGAKYINMYFGDSCDLFAVYMANIEGDPVLDDGSNGTGSEAGAGYNPWADCQPGQDFLAVGEWVAYAACLIAGLPGLIASAFMGLLTQLFVPRGVADQWDDLVDVASSRVPFVWVASVVGFLETVGGAGPALDTVIEMGSYTVTLPLATFSAVGADWRWVGVGVVSVATALTIWGRLRGAVGAGGDE